MIRAIGRKRYLIAWVGLLAYLLIGLWNAPGMVLCFEKDGRVALETAIAGVCSDSWEAEQQFKSASAKSAVSNLSCKRCTDIPVSMVGIQPNARIIQVHPEPIHDVAILEDPEIVTGYLATVITTVLPHPPPFPPVLHRFLNTVILVI